LKQILSRVALTRNPTLKTLRPELKARICKPKPWRKVRGEILINEKNISDRKTLQNCLGTSRNYKLCQ